MYVSLEYMKDKLRQKFTTDRTFSNAITKIKKNNTAHENDLIFMTKAIGTGILSAALKRNLLGVSDEKSMVESMCQLNKIGQELGEID